MSYLKLFINNVKKDKKTKDNLNCEMIQFGLFLLKKALKKKLVYLYYEMMLLMNNENIKYKNENENSKQVKLKNRKQY